MCEHENECVRVRGHVCVRGLKAEWKVRPGTQGGIHEECPAPCVWMTNMFLEAEEQASLSAKAGSHLCGLLFCEEQNEEESHFPWNNTSVSMYFTKPRHVLHLCFSMCCLMDVGKAIVQLLQYGT